MMFCLVRTDATGKPQTGVTFILIDMTVPGLRVDPIIMLSGEHIQNAVFLDEVRVPKENVVGEVNKGWTVAKYLLEFERGGSSYGPRLLQQIARLRRTATALGKMTRDLEAHLTEAEIAATTLEAAELMMMSKLTGGGTPGLEASMMKIKGTELSQRLTEIAMDLAGIHVQPFQPEHTETGGPVVRHAPTNQGLVGPDALVTTAPKYLNDRAGSIYAGSNEIQRNILAKGQLGL
jgi:alkylation response protein AidB-like acyl-CoA dehydrogenase